MGPMKMGWSLVCLFLIDMLLYVVSLAWKEPKLKVLPTPSTADLTGIDEHHILHNSDISSAVHNIMHGILSRRLRDCYMNLLVCCLCSP